MKKKMQIKINEKKSTSSYSMFSVPLIIIEIKNWKEKKNKIISFIEKQELSPNHKENHYTSYFSSQNCENFNLEEIFNNEFSEFCKSINVKHYHLKSFWVQKYENMNLHSIHNHGSIGYSFVCYVSFNPEKHESTTFIAPFNNFITGEIISHSPNVTEGMIIFFPSAIHHYAPINMSDNSRIILSGNMDVLM